MSKLSDGNQIYTTDFRSVYATAFESILGVDPKWFLAGRFPVQPFVLASRQTSSVGPALPGGRTGPPDQRRP